MVPAPQEGDKPINRGQPAVLFGQKPFDMVQGFFNPPALPSAGTGTPSRIPVCLPGIDKDPLKPPLAEYPFKEANGVVPGPGPVPPIFQERFQVIDGGVGGVKLYKGRLNQGDNQTGGRPCRAGFHPVLLFGKKEGHWRPVARNTSTDGRFRHLRLKRTQDRGKAGSQVTLK
jgi:hypothetical protein